MADWNTPSDEPEVRRAVEIIEPITVDDSLEEDSAGDEVDLDAFGRAAVPPWVADAEPEDLTRALEAVCFSLNRPVTLAEAASILGCSGAAVTHAVDALMVELRDRGIMLQRHQDEFQLVTRPHASWAVHRALNPERPGRLSKASLETLAIIAYRQPVTRGTVEAIRGVNCDAVLDSLERRGLIAEVGRQDSPGHPRLFGTTLRFLQIVGLERIDDLPPLPDGVTVPDFTSAEWEITDEDETPANLEMSLAGSELTAGDTDGTS